MASGVRGRPDSHKSAADFFGVVFTTGRPSVQSSAADFLGLPAGPSLADDSLGFPPSPSVAGGDSLGLLDPSATTFGFSPPGSLAASVLTSDGLLLPAGLSSLSDQPATSVRGFAIYLFIDDLNTYGQHVDLNTYGKHNRTAQSRADSDVRGRVR